MQKNILDRFYCIKSFCHLKSLGKRFEKFIFVLPIIINGAQKHKGFIGFKKVYFRAKLYVILTSLNYIHFYAHFC